MAEIYETDSKDVKSGETIERSLHSRPNVPPPPPPPPAPKDIKK